MLPKLKCQKTLKCPKNLNLNQIKIQEIGTDHLCLVWVFFSLTIWVLLELEFCHNLSFWVLSQFGFMVFFVKTWVFELSLFRFLSCITIWVFEFHHNLKFWASSQFEFLRFFPIWLFFSFITRWVFKFCHNLSFLVSSQFEFTTIWVFECHYKLSC